MISVDLLLAPASKTVVKFIIANKLTIFIGYYLLEKLALKTKTTVDDKILTFLKNTFLRLIGKGFKVDDEYNKLNELGLIHEKLDGKILKYYKNKLLTSKSSVEKNIKDPIISEINSGKKS